MLAEVVMIFWAAGLKHWLATWMFIVFSLELGSALIETNNVAANYQWSEFVPKHGFIFRVLNIVYPNGHYSKYGTALWILHGTWSFCPLMLAHTPAEYTHLVVLLNGLSILLIPAALGYVLHIYVYLFAFVSGWKEPMNRAAE